MKDKSHLKSYLLSCLYSRPSHLERQIINLKLSIFMILNVILCTCAKLEISMSTDFWLDFYSKEWIVRLSNNYGKIQFAIMQLCIFFLAIFWKIDQGWHCRRICWICCWWIFCLPNIITINNNTVIFFWWGIFNIVISWILTHHCACWYLFVKIQYHLLTGMCIFLLMKYSHPSIDKGLDISSYELQVT